MASNTPNQSTIKHFTHIHPLTEFSSTTFFNCDGCKTNGSDKWYRCESCNYDLHEYCATCPLTLQTFIHPQHELSLVIRCEQSKRGMFRTCDLCHEQVEGLFYRCKICDFDVHPECTQLFPQHLSLEDVHPDHPLEFCPAGGASTCVLCHAPSKSVRYRCDLCKFDIHIECLVEACDKSSSEQTEATSGGSKTDQKTSKSKRRRVFGFMAKKAVGMIVTTALFGFPLDPTLLLY
ncbi:unnamed protein product [Cochlearia groenlandica]